MARTLLIALLLPVCAAAQTTGTTSLSVTVASAATISIGTATTTLTAATTWGDYTGTTNGTVRMRTSKSGGSGSVTVQITTAFASGGPGTSNLSYTCSVAESSEATACSGTVSASGTSAPALRTGRLETAPLAFRSHAALGARLDGGRVDSCPPPLSWERWPRRAPVEDPRQRLDP